jgi:hypothetical protein
LREQTAHNKFSGLPEHLQAVSGLFPFPAPVADKRQLRNKPWELP